jgi:hypothetical protein
MTHPSPEIRLIPADRLIVDTTVQRDYTDRGRVDEIAAKFNPDALGVLIVSDRGNGTIHIIDGAHRRAAAIAAIGEDAKLECKVYYELSRAEEAAMFRALNFSRTVSALDKFRVRVVEGDHTAVALLRVLTRNGWKTQLARTSASFNAVVSLEEVYKGGRKGEEENLGAVETLISLLTSAYGHDPDGMRREIISGVGALLLRHGGRVDLQKLTTELSAYSGGPLALLGAARGLQKHRKGKVSDSMAEVVTNLVNKGRRGSGRLPDWRDAA